jgi:hypothetical protein
MAGLWNRKFDHTNGEQRICKHCGVSFHTMKPRYSCNPCLNANQKVYEVIKRSKYPKKDNYPFNNRTNEAGARFCSIRTALSNAWKQYNKTGDRDVITQHYDKQLKEIEDNGILKWILDRRDKETAEARQIKSRKTITKDYPNHHDYYEY